MLWLYLFIAALFLVYWKLRDVYKHWDKLGVTNIKPIYIFGDLAPFVFRRITFAENLQKLYNAFPNNRYFGIYQFFLPTIVLRDPELIKQITVKDFNHFVDHRPLISEEIDPFFGKALISLTGQRWRDMRSTLSPAFTSTKMKAMFVLVSDVSEQFTQYFLNQNRNETIIEMKDAFTRYANDVIATSAFGLKCDSLTDKTNDFYEMGRLATDIKGFKLWKFFMFSIVPSVMKLFKLEMLDKRSTRFFRDLILDAMKTREEKSIVRPDMIHLMMEARKGQLKHEESTKVETGFSVVEESDVGKVHRGTKDLSDEDIVAQALLFFIAGFDTSSTLMSYLTYELALNPQIQERLQKEVDATLEDCGGKLTYDGLQAMTYMDMVVSECLRKWPPFSATDRKCVDPYTIEPTRPEEKAVRIEKNDLVWFPIYPIHRDPEYYPNPDKFDPERFNDENKHNIRPFTFIPFGFGPRACIGSRFALMQTKAVMFHLLAKFNLEVTEKTEIPLKISKQHFNMSTENGIWLAITKR